MANLNIPYFFTITRHDGRLPIYQLPCPNCKRTGLINKERNYWLSGGTYVIPCECGAKIVFMPKEGYHGDHAKQT